MSLDLRDALHELATAEGPDVRPDAWAAEALRRTERRRRHRMMSVAAGGVAVAVALVLALPGGRSTSPPVADAVPTIPAVIPVPSSNTPSLSDKPIRRASMIVTLHNRDYLVGADGEGLRAAPYKDPSFIPETVNGRKMGIVTPVAGEECSAALSSDGTKLAWLPCGKAGSWTRSPATDVRVVTLATGRTRDISMPNPPWGRQGVQLVALGAQLSWSPDGSAIVVSDANLAIMADLSTGRTRRLPDGSGGAVTWSPDGKTMLVTDSVSPFSDVAFLVDRAGKKLASLSLPVVGHSGRVTWFWGRDDNTVDAFWSQGSKHELVTMRRDGTVIRRLPNPAAINSQPIGWRGGRLVLSLGPSAQKPGTYVGLLDPATGETAPLFRVPAGLLCSGYATGLVATASIR